MADYQVTLHVSQTIYERAKQIAEENAQPVERFLRVQLDPGYAELAVLPMDEQEELAAFQHLSDDALFSLAAEQMPPDTNARMVVLGDRTSRGTITEAEAQEYAELVERGNRLILRKAWAANTLMDRGHKISQRIFASENKFPY